MNEDVINEMAHDEPYVPSPLLAEGSVVYFIRHGDDGPIKIGWTVDVDRRLMLLQIGNPIPLRLLCTVPGNQILEHWLHQRFEGYRVSGEWFEPCDELLALLSERDLADHLEREYDADLRPAPKRTGFCAVCKCNLAATKVHPEHPETCTACVEFAAVRDAGGDPFEEAA